MTTGRDRTPPRARGKAAWKPDFLGALEKLGVVAYAANAAGVARSTVYEARESDDEFRAAWNDAAEVAADVLEAEAFRRAVEGTERPVYQGGRLVGGERQYSDSLLMFLLKARRPEEFRERADVRHSGEVRGITLSRLAELARDETET